MSYPQLKTYGLLKKDTGAKPTRPQQKISFKLAAKKQKKVVMQPPSSNNTPLLHNFFSSSPEDVKSSASTPGKLKQPDTPE
eukprot:2630287-Rhodomonas_salina.1